MNGIEAVTEIKRRYPDVRVLVMTLHRRRTTSTQA